VITPFEIPDRATVESWTMPPNGDAAQRWRRELKLAWCYGGAAATVLPAVASRKRLLGVAP
jgi:hypothetical protein